MRSTVLVCMLRKRAASCGPTGASTGYSDSTGLIGVGWIDIESSITFSCEESSTMRCPGSWPRRPLKAPQSEQVCAHGSRTRAHLGAVFEKNSPFTTLVTCPLSNPTVEEPELYSERATLFVGVLLSPKVMPRRNTWPIFLRPALRAPSYKQIGPRSGLHCSGHVSRRSRVISISRCVSLTARSAKLSNSDVPTTGILPDPA